MVPLLSQDGAGGHHITLLETFGLSLTFSIFYGDTSFLISLKVVIFVSIILLFLFARKKYSC